MSFRSEPPPSVHTIDVNPQPLITGTGLITPLGRTVDSTWQSLLAGRFILDHTRVDPEIDDGRPRVTQLASIAARQAIESAGWTNAILADDRTALIIGTSKGPIEDWITASSAACGVANQISPLAPTSPKLACDFASFHQSTACGVANQISPLATTSPKLACDFASFHQPTSHSFANQPPPLAPLGLHQIAESLAQEFHFGSGPRQTLSAACASGLHALIHAAMLIQSGEADRVLVVAAEASVHPLFIGSFQRLGVLPPENFGCRPFDQYRAGFLMSEAAAAVCLESSSVSRDAHAGRFPAPKISRFALGADATHLTGIDPSAKTLSRLLHQVIAETPIDLIHAHGTGTPMNDPIELSALQQSLPSPQSQPPHLYSHKGTLGHSLGAAGLISIVLNVESHRRQIIPPNIQSRRPLNTGQILLSQQPQHRTIHRSLSIATGFGGPTAVVSIENP